MGGGCDVTEEVGGGCDVTEEVGGGCDVTLVRLTVDDDALLNAKVGFLNRTGLDMSGGKRRHTR